MEKVLIIFGSTTGMTEMSAREVETGLKSAGVTDVQLLNVIEANVSMMDSYKYIIFGCSTWDYGSLQYDFEPFHNEMKTYNFEGKKTSVFGCGDKVYGDTYCLALSIIQNTVTDQGGEMLIGNLDIDSDLSDEKIEMIRTWGKKFAESMR